MHKILTDKFADSTISIRALFPLEPAALTAWNLYVSMIRMKTEAFPCREALVKALGQAYAARVHHGLSGYGGQICLEIRFSFLKPELASGPGYEEDIKTLLEQLLCHPLLDQDGLDEAKYLLKTHLHHLQEDPDYAAMRMAMELAAPDAPLAVSLQGRLEDVDQVSLEDIRSLHERFQKCGKLVLAIGPVPAALQTWLEAIPEPEQAALTGSPIPGRRPVKTSQERAISQTSLVQVYAAGILPDDPLYTALCVLNILLGEGENSLLFEEVRENHSCCYSISTSLVAYDGALILSCGTARENVPLVETLIRQQLERIRKGEFDQDRLQTARLELEDRLRSGQDSPAALLEREFRQVVKGKRTFLQARIDKIRNVQKQDVQEAAARLQLCSQALVMEPAA